MAAREQATRHLGYIALITTFLIHTPGHASDNQDAIKACQKIKDKIEHYTRLKRNGGSASQMAYLHKNRNHYRALRTEKHCSRYRNKLQ